MPAPELREVGRIGRTHGVRGDLYVDLLTDREERLAVGARLLAGSTWLTVTAARRVVSRWLVHFDGVDDRTAAARFSTSVLFAEPLPSSDDDLYVHDLIGSRVIDLQGADHGLCVAVVANPAHDMLELSSGLLVPVTFVLGCADGITTIDPPDGLMTPE